MKANWRNVAAAVALFGGLATASNNGVGAVYGFDANAENGGTEVAAKVDDSGETEMNDAASKSMFEKLVELAEKDGRGYAICEVCDGVSRT